MKCLNCGMEFDEPSKIRTTQASLFGIPRVNDPLIDVEICPYCGCDELEREDKEE